MTNEDRVRERAHCIWEEEGRPHGRHEEHWHRASREILGERAPTLTQPGGAVEDISAPGFPYSGIPDRMSVGALSVSQDLPGPDDNLPAGTLRKRLLS